MKRLLLIVLFLTTIAASATDENTTETKLPPLTQQRLVALELTLHKTKYPITFSDLFEKLGGKDSMIWCCVRFNWHAGKSQQFADFAITDPKSTSGVYQIEFELKEAPENFSKAQVINARLSFLSPFGARFYADDPLK